MVCKYFPCGSCHWEFSKVRTSVLWTCGMFNLAKYCTEVNSLCYYCFPWIKEFVLRLHFGFIFAFNMLQWVTFNLLTSDHTANCIAFLCLLTTKHLKLIQTKNLKFGNCFYPAPVLMVLPLWLIHRSFFYENTKFSLRQLHIRLGKVCTLCTILLRKLDTIFAPGKFSIKFSCMLKVQGYTNMTFRATDPEVSAFTGGVTLVIM